MSKTQGSSEWLQRYVARKVKVQISIGIGVKKIVAPIFVKDVSNCSARLVDSEKEQFTPSAMCSFQFMDQKGQNLVFW